LNDSNTGWRFFASYALASEKTRVIEEIIRLFGVILQTLASGRKIISAEFGKYAVTNAEIFVKEYPWYYIPAAFHKVSMHGKINH
jgi:hypothetical protein